MDKFYRFYRIHGISGTGWHKWDGRPVFTESIAGREIVGERFLRGVKKCLRKGAGALFPDVDLEDESCESAGLLRFARNNGWVLVPVIRKA
jgi:hypothetical protein